MEVKTEKNVITAARAILSSDEKNSTNFTDLKAAIPLPVSLNKIEENSDCNIYG